MSVPGWYPDPGGAAGQYRYWDGRAWSPQTSAHPPAPEEPGPGGPRKRSPIGLIIGALAAVLVLVLLGVFVLPRLFGAGPVADPEPGQTSSPTISAWNETSSPTASPSATPSTPSPTPSDTGPSDGVDVNCPEADPLTRTTSDTDGQLVSGGLVIDKIPGWRMEPMWLTFADNVAGQTLQINPTWYSDLGLAGLRRDLGFAEPKRAAEMAMQCLASSNYYRDIVRRADTWSKAVKIGSHNAWSIRSDIYVDRADKVPGDTVTIVVVDTGSAQTLGMAIGIATIKDVKVQALVDRALSTLKVA